MADKEKDANGLAYDFTLIPSNLTDLTAIPIVGGLLTQQYVEMGEEIAIEEFKTKENKSNNEKNKS